MQFVRSSRLAWAGHAWIAIDGHLTKMEIVNKIDRKIPRKRSRQRWLDVV